MADELKGRVALITGGGRGLGETICLTLGAAGATVVAADLRQELVDNLAMRLRDQGVPTLALPLDVGDEAQAEATVRQIVGKFGRLDVLVNNAGTDVTLPV